jgi:hypothetical protein
VSDIFDEVEEDLRADRAQRFLKRYGTWIAAAMLLVVAGVAGLQGWRWWQDRQAVKAAEGFLAASAASAVPTADAKAVAAQFSNAAVGAPAGYRTLARLRAAALLVGEDTPAALAQYDQLGKDSAVEPLYRDLATLLWGLHGLGVTEPAQIESRLAPLAVATNPWHASAQEVRALAALQRGDSTLARRGLEALANDVTAPQGVRERAGRLLVGLGG